MNNPATPAYIVRQEVQCLIDREIAHLYDKIQLEAKEKQTALDLQRMEYHRRLNELNNAHERAERAVRETVPREMFETFLNNHAKWREEIQGKLSAAEGASAANARFFGLLVVIVGLVFSAIALWMKR